uniref:Reverse transcriptase zinc-binding domain-containing protein n=1 Tax=Brassica oleracea var. oleracea TaxID=109376 RepID=A0A0D3D960_BRAOL
MHTYILTMLKSLGVWRLAGARGHTHMGEISLNLVNIRLIQDSRTETLFPDRVPRMITFGPNIKSLLAFSSKRKCSLNLKHFIWQILSDTLPVLKTLKTRGTDCDLWCSICG